MEIEFERDPDADAALKFRIRRLIRGALKAIDPSADCPPVRSRDFAAWGECLEAVADRLFWDHDFLEEGKFADLDPLGVEVVEAADRHCRRLLLHAATPRAGARRPPDRYLRRAAGCPELNDPWDREGG